MIAALADAELVYPSCNVPALYFSSILCFVGLLSSLNVRLKTLSVNFKKAFLEINESKKP